MENKFCEKIDTNCPNPLFLFNTIQSGGLCFKGNILLNEIGSMTGTSFLFEIVGADRVLKIMIRDYSENKVHNWFNKLVTDPMLASDTKQNVINKLTKEVTNSYNMGTAGIGPKVYNASYVEYKDKIVQFIISEKYEGDVFSYFKKVNDNTPEVFKQMMELIKKQIEGGLYCEDIKPQNFVYKQLSRGGIDVKMIDFDSNFCKSEFNSGLIQLSKDVKIEPKTLLYIILTIQLFMMSYAVFKYGIPGSMGSIQKMYQEHLNDWDKGEEKIKPLYEDDIVYAFLNSFFQDPDIKQVIDSPKVLKKIIMYSLANNKLFTRYMRGVVFHGNMYSFDSSLADEIVVKLEEGTKVTPLMARNYRSNELRNQASALAKIGATIGLGLATKKVLKTIISKRKSKGKVGKGKVSKKTSRSKQKSRKH